METVKISKDEYEKLRLNAIKIKIIEETIHGELSSENLMKLQEKQGSLAFLKDEKEDIYNINDLKEIWKKVQ